MTKKGKANGSFFGNFLYEQILFQIPQFLNLDYAAQFDGFMDNYLI
jgi:hypothetical protein